jgi:predicted NUDIX family NTP pyrophosphohydrolase
MAKISAGLLVYRIRDRSLQVLLVHPGGPLWRGRDAGAWTIPKGLAEPGEDLLTAARREFAEETAHAPEGDFITLTKVTQKGGKVVHAWAIEGEFDPDRFRSNTFTLEWPPRSKRFAEFPEADRAEFFSLETARQKINRAQVALLDELEAHLRARGSL